MTFYIDLILMENIIMNYIILLTTGMICKSKIKQIRLILSGIIGGVYAIMLYIVKLQIYNNQIIKIMLSISMVYIAFNSKNIKVLLKQIVIFYLTSFCFGGASYYLLYCIKPNLINNINGVLTGTYPIKAAILGGLLGFFIINISFKLIKNKLIKKDIYYNVEIFYKNSKANIKVILDTGNLLVDPINGIPVLIVESVKLKNIISEDILNSISKEIFNNSLENVDDEIKRRCSIIPFSSIGKNNGIIIGFRPDYIIIHTEDQKEIRKKVVIGIYNNKIAKNGLYSGLMGLNLLNNHDRSDNKNEYNSNIKI